MNLNFILPRVVSGFNPATLRATSIGSTFARLKKKSVYYRLHNVKQLNKDN